MDATGIHARETPALDRVVQVGVAAGRVISVSFPESAPPDAGDDHPVLDRLVAALAGDSVDLSGVAVALTVPTDQRQVLEAVRTVPRGESVSVGTLARMAGLDDEDAGDRATVEAALAANPVPVLVPDHRVEGPGATPQAVADHLRAVESGGD